MVTNRLSEAMKLFCSCQTRLKLELKHEFHMVIKFEECLKACHRVIIQGGGEHIEDCARIPFSIWNQISCCPKMFVTIRLHLKNKMLTRHAQIQSIVIDCIEHASKPT